MTYQEFNEIMSKEGSVAAYEFAFGKSWAAGLNRCIPSYMQGGLVRWACFGVIPGGFLQRVLRNDLMGALSEADGTNQRLIWEYGNFLHNYAPTGCYGSPEKFEKWHARGGQFTKDN